MNNDHLTSEQMEGLLMDAEREQRSQHLSSCRICSGEMEKLHSAVDELRAAAVRMAAVGAGERQRKFALLPEASRRTPRVMWAMLATAALICAAGPMTLRHKPAAVRSTSASKQQIQRDASDEQLLSSVQSDLASAVPEPMLPLEASVSSTGATNSTYSASDTRRSIAKENE